LTNVIPLIARSESFSEEQISSIKEHILSELQAANIRPFLFGLNPDAAQHTYYPSAPFAISTTPSKDNDTMDASLLMSPDYVQPLIESELQALVSQMFDRDTISWLRHSAAKKFIQWRASSTPVSKPQSLYQPLSSSCSSQVLTAPVGATTSYALARITDHTQREERIAQVRLANWAADLQRSLQNERARFDALARSERAVWLTERLGECVQDGTIVPISHTRKELQQFETGSGALVKQGTYSRRQERERDMRGAIDVHDPLGLLKLNEEMKRRGWVVLKLGILGGIAFWITRSLQGVEVQNGWWGFGNSSGLNFRDRLELWWSM
jgi:hypothetical protein